MRTGDTIFFELGDSPHRATVRAVIFKGTSRYIPDDRLDPWREVLVVETDSGSVILRDRMRATTASNEIVSERPRWSVGTYESTAVLLHARAAEVNDEEGRLYRRAARSLGKFAVAEVV